MTDTMTKEAVRYLGFGRREADEATLRLVAAAFSQLEKAASPRIVWRVFDLKTAGEGRLDIGGMEVESRSLWKNMKGCCQAVVLGATLGSGVDLLMRRQSLTDMAAAVVTQACAAAMLEEYLDGEQEKIGRELEREGKYLRPRFSPGYGDFSICHQGQLLAMLEAPKRIGLSLTDSSMLTPVKSVTAVIGVSTVKEPCHRKGCEACGKTDCIYRRNEG
ncbi:vitamin B12 dependent-methionine synthase activation domain-containing protein [Lachnoclostridium sp. An118]|uniref:vitamin B12 dependent-methionine synthase activation domain-containing protein n=1 Tax=Lachnoclostridium sp. An118 TaxID=1965547 RepID=UPI00117B995C|nr:vitamin B12 dependent-methionine synthase activation domain-containing protein [Lachnoclostridium sp. An118]